MAYTTIDDPTIYFNTKLYTANATSGHAITGIGHQPDWLWIKQRSNAYNHEVFDSVRGATKRLLPNDSDTETTVSGVTSFDSDGFTLGDAYNANKDSGDSIVAWSWKAGGTAPAITYTVKVVSDSGNKYRFDDFGTSAVTLDLQEGGTYTFDQSDSSNSGHPLRFSTTSNGTHGGGSEYTTNVTTTGTPGSSGAKTVITVAASAPTLYYYCTQHSGMGGQANTNSTHGSSNFSGSIQSTVSANTTAGFSIVSYTGTGSTGTIGHGLGAVPKMIIVKNRDGSYNWYVYHVSLGAGYEILLNSNAASDTTSQWNSGTPTSSVFSIGNSAFTNGSGNDIIAYCFTEKKGFSKFGSYTGNGNADGAFIYTGFKPAWVMIKQTNTTGNWAISDNQRLNNSGNQDGGKGNYVPHMLASNLSNNEAHYGGGSSNEQDYLSNGFKLRSTNTYANQSGGTYIYMAFAENSFVTSTGIPTTAR